MTETDDGRGTSNDVPAPTDDPRFKSYFTRIEKHFCEVKGSPLILSPRDVQKAARWFKDNVPLKAVALGIERHFERLEPSKRNRAVVLAFCEHEIYDAWQSGDYRAGELPPASSAKSCDIKSSVEIIRNRLASLSQKEKDPSIRDVLEKHTAKIDSMRKTFRTNTKPETAEKKLTDIESALIKSLTKNSPPELIEGFQCQIEQELAPYKKRMSAKVYKATLSHHTGERLLEHYGVPRLSLY